MFYSKNHDQRYLEFAERKFKRIKNGSSKKIDDACIHKTSVLSLIVRDMKRNG